MANRHQNKDIFREKSLKRVTSPENLDKYIKSTTPSLWLLLTSVILILVGVLVWATYGKIDSSSIVGCQVESGKLTAYISEQDYEKIQKDSYILIEENSYAIDNVNGPDIVSEESNEFLLQAAGIEAGSWYYTVTCKADLPDGKYKGTAIFEKVSPITFIVN